MVNQDWERKLMSPYEKDISLAAAYFVIAKKRVSALILLNVQKLSNRTNHNIKTRLIML